MRRRAVAVRTLFASATLLLAGCRTARPPDAAAPAGSAGKGPTSLTVEIGGLASDAGQLAVALFDSPSGFEQGKPLRSAFLEIRDGASIWPLEGLDAGDYAVKVFHDENDNGTLDLNPLGAPTEPYGFSNNARGRLGPPDWGRARLTLGPGLQRIAVNVR